MQYCNALRFKMTNFTELPSDSFRMEEDAIMGTCKEMCPPEERLQREKEGLLHRLEQQPNPSQNRRKLADPSKTIKCFSRSAAGQATVKPDALRPSPVLVMTVEYLLRNVVPLWEERPLDIYEYVTDRLRAVRQDMTIQRMRPDECISILEPMIRFHALFGYILCSHSRFEAHLNDTYLNECFYKILECYPRASEGRRKNQSEIETIYCCVHMNKPEELVAMINFDDKLTLLELLAAWTTNNYCRSFRLISKFDGLARASLARHVPKFRARALRSLCFAMSSPNSSYPLDRLTVLLFYNSMNCALEDCKRMGIRHSGTMCHFFKKDLINTIDSFPPQKWYFVDEVLPSDLTSILL